MKASITIAVPNTLIAALGFTDVQEAFHYTKSLYPHGAFVCDPPLPAIVLKHQFYSLLHDRTSVDREVVSIEGELHQCGQGGGEYRGGAAPVWTGRW